MAIGFAYLQRKELRNYLDHIPKVFPAKMISHFSFIKSNFIAVMHIQLDPFTNIEYF